MIISSTIAFITVLCSDFDKLTRLSLSQSQTLCPTAKRRKKFVFTHKGGVLIEAENLLHRHMIFHVLILLFIYETISHRLYYIKSFLCFTILYISSKAVYHLITFKIPSLSRLIIPLDNA